MSSLRSTSLPATYHGAAVAVGRAADVQAVALAQRVVREPPVPAAFAAFVVADHAGRLRQILVQEVGERPLADEADAGAVLFRGYGQAGAARELADLAFQQIAEREQNVGQVRRRHGSAESSSDPCRDRGLCKAAARRRSTVSRA